MGRLSVQEKHWVAQLENPESTEPQKAKAAEELEKIKRRHARSKVRGRYKKRSASVEDDPKPAWYPLDGGSYSEYLEQLSAWEKRHPEGDEEEPAPAKPAAKVEPQKAAPVVRPALIVEFARVDPTTLFAPLPVAGPAPKPKQPERVTREPKEGTSGFFFRERFWDLPIDEQKTKLQRVNRDPALKMEWENITSAMRAPREVLSPLSESEKARAFAPPVVRPPSEVFPVGQPLTIDEARAPFQPTMANAKDAGISISPDRRGWLPDINPLS